MEDFYAVLGIDRGASKKDVKAAYVQLLRKFMSEKAPVQYQRLRQAYETLRDGKSRAEYDAIRLYGYRIDGLQAQKPRDAAGTAKAFQPAIQSAGRERESDPIITDRCIYALGVETYKYDGSRWVPGSYEKLIPAHTVIPCSKHRVYPTVVDSQTEMVISVYQGEEVMAAQNLKVGEFALSGIPPAPAGQERIAFEFALDINSILQITATLISTGKRAGITIRGKGMNWEELEAAKAQNERQWRQSKLAERVESLIDSAERKIADNSTAETARLQAILQRLKDALVAEDEARVDELDSELTNELFDVM